MLWGQPINAPSISYTFLLFQGWLVVMLDLHHDTVLSLLTLVACSFLEHSSQVKWDRWGWPDFFSPVPFWEDSLADQNCCPFPGWEEAKHEGRQGGRKGGRGGNSSQEQERWTHWCSMTAPREVNHCRSHIPPSPSLTSTSCQFGFTPGDKLENHLVYFILAKQQTREQCGVTGVLSWPLFQLGDGSVW